MGTVLTGLTKDRAQAAKDHSASTVGLLGMREDNERSPPCPTPGSRIFASG